MREVCDRHGTESFEGRAALGLKVAADVQFDELRLPFRYDDGEPERLREKADAWNRAVCTVAAAWKGTEGYDEDRWRLVSQMTADAGNTGFDPAAHVLNHPGSAEWKRKAGQEADAMRDEFLGRQIRRPEEADGAPLSWRAEKVTWHASLLSNVALSRTSRHFADIRRGTADDALSVLATGESIRRELLAVRGRHIHESLVLGATWTQTAEVLGRTPEQLRAELRYYAGEHPDLYHGADQRVPVSALLELGDDETVPAPEEGR